MMDDADDVGGIIGEARVDSVFKLLHLTLLLATTSELTCMSQNAFIH
jgi:hypothetical protein